MDRDADKLGNVQWLAHCAKRLRQQWPRADVASIEEAALELWDSARLRQLAGEEAAEIWLKPLQRNCGECGGNC